MPSSTIRLHQVSHAVARWENRTGVDIESVVHMPPLEFLCLSDWAEGVNLHDELLEVLQADGFAAR